MLGIPKEIWALKWEMFKLNEDFPATVTEHPEGTRTEISSGHVW